jgi:hypothetical protein
MVESLNILIRELLHQVTISGIILRWVGAFAEDRFLQAAGLLI